MRTQVFLQILVTILGMISSIGCIYDEGYVSAQQDQSTQGIPIEVSSSYRFPYMSNVDAFYFDYKLYKGKLPREAIDSNKSKAEEASKNFCIKEPISYKLNSILTSPIYNDTFNHVDFVNFKGLTYIISASPFLRSIQIYSMLQDSLTSPYRLELVKGLNIQGLEGVFKTYNESSYAGDDGDPGLLPPPNDRNMNKSAPPPPPGNPPPLRPAIERLTCFLDLQKSWIIIRLFSAISVYDVSTKDSPVFLGNFSFISDKSYANETSVLKVQYSAGCLYAQIGSLSLWVYCVRDQADNRIWDNKNMEFYNAYTFADDAWADQRTKNMPESALNDFWIEANILYAVGEAGLFIFDVSEVKKGIVKTIITHNDIQNGRLVKVANNSLIIIKEKRMPRSPVSEWYFDEYFVYPSTESFKFLRNREVFLHYAPIMSMHRTQKYVVIPNVEDTVRIFRHSTPQVMEFPQLERTPLYVENLVKIHQSSSVYGSNLVLGVFPGKIQLFVVETEPLKVICTPEWPPQDYTLSVDFYTITCPQKIAAKDSDPTSFCKYRENFYISTGVSQSDSDKNLAIGLGVGFGLLFLIILSFCLYRKYRNLKGDFNQLQEAITQQNNSSSVVAGGKNASASHFDIDRSDKPYDKPGNAEVRKLDDIYDVNYK